MSTTEVERALDVNVTAAIRKLASQVALGVVNARRTCLTCIHFNEQSETCLLYNVRPPARVLAFGCDAHVDAVPF